MTVGLGVDGAVRRIQTVFDNRSRLKNVTSHSATSGGSIVNDVQYTYNDFGQVITEFQQHGGAVNTSTSPKVQYAYANGSANHIRPLTIKYPKDTTEIGFEYGTGHDDQLSRVQKLKLGSNESTA